VREIKQKNRKQNRKMKITNPKSDKFNALLSNVKSICEPISMIRDDRFVANICAVQHVIENNISGDVVEVGVWKGGSVVSMIMTLLDDGVKNRRVHLFDTFSGMTPHSEKDIDLSGASAEKLLQNPFFKCESSLEEVTQNVLRTGYPAELIEFHVGDIRVNQSVPDLIAILRLDTDWYDSTKAELEQFYPNVVSGGIVMIDDYGHWQGCRQAVDEFLASHPELKLEGIDYTGRFFVKP